MPLSSNHEKWPVDVVGCAVTMMRIATAKWKIGYKQSGERKGVEVVQSIRHVLKGLMQEERKATACQGAVVRWRD